MKKGVKILLVILLLAAAVGVYFLVDHLAGPQDIKLNQGWQKIKLEGIVPAGAVVVVDAESNTVLPVRNPETKRATGFVSRGRINFLDSEWIVTETEVWVYYPEEYEFILDKGEFNQECLDKLSDLTGNKETSCKEFDFGKP